MNFYIKVGSITNAQRSVKILKKFGYRAVIKKIDEKNIGDGCGYAVGVYPNDDNAISVLKSNGINVLGVMEK